MKAAPNSVLVVAVHYNHFSILFFDFIEINLVKFPLCSKMWVILAIGVSTLIKIRGKRKKTTN
ncbi:MAG: hypothetical protein RBG13Loki_1164 [Promethearchaeota archaeon CR_4]|nr:MAG: hypothetical protein RBG13Loki_1164 [Candidatus Lokiarchaeota archaeon CR_4]